jgi:hypothetical protein
MDERDERLLQGIIDVGGARPHHPPHDAQHGGRYHAQQLRDGGRISGGREQSQRFGSAVRMAQSSLLLHERVDAGMCAATGKTDHGPGIQLATPGAPDWDDFSQPFDLES